MIFSGVNTLTLYYNGIQKISYTIPAFSLVTPSTSSTIAIGSNSVGAFSGYEDDISIYNRALSAAEVAGLYEASKNQYRNEILCAWEV